MLVYLILFAICFGISLLHAAGVSGGWAWDALNGLGLLALALVTALFVDTGRGGRLTIHRKIGWAAVFLVVAHAFGLSLLHPVSLEYFSFSGPLYIGMGLLSALLLFVLAQSAEPEHRGWFRGFENFRSIHGLLAIAALASGLYHVLASGLYFDPTEAFLLTCLGLVVVALPRLRVHLRSLRSATGQRLVWLSAMAVMGFVLLKVVA